MHAEVVSVYEGTSAVLECPGPGSIINWYQIPDPDTTPLSSSEEIRDYYVGEDADPSDYRAYYIRSNSNSGNVDRDGTYTIPNIDLNVHDGLWYKCLRGPGIPIQLEVKGTCKNNFFFTNVVPPKINSIMTINVEVLLIQI